jgi:hypothetical protein
VHPLGNAGASRQRPRLVSRESEHSCTRGTHVRGAPEVHVHVHVCLASSVSARRSRCISTFSTVLELCARHLAMSRWDCRPQNTHTRTASEARLACPDREAANVCNFALSRREGEPPGSPDIFYPGSAPAPTSTQHLHSMGGPDASTAQLRQRVSGPLVTSRPRISRTPPRQSRPIHPCPPPARAMPCRRPNGPPPTQ